MKILLLLLLSTNAIADQRNMELIVPLMFSAKACIYDIQTKNNSRTFACGAALSVNPNDIVNLVKPTDEAEADIIKEYLQAIKKLKELTAIY